MSYREGQFHIKQTPHPHPLHPLGPTTPYTPILTHPPGPYHPQAEFCVQFWSVVHKQDH